MASGALSAALLSFYTIHFASHGLWEITNETIQGALIVLVIGLGLSAPMALIKRREDRLRDALRQRARQLEERNAELTEANAALEAFGYVVSHDLKEPVRAIENYLDAAKESYGSKEGREDLDRAAEANARMVRLLQGLLSYSRASSLATTTRTLRVKDVVEGETCRTQYETMLREKGARLDVEEGIPDVRGDEVILAQLLGNVILNAIRHNDGKAAIRVRAPPDAAPGRVHLLVEDDGAGFPPDVLSRFGQLRGNRPATLRAGFGLAISQRAAQRLGGRIWLANGPGAQVHLDLPAADGDRSNALAKN